MVVLFDLVDVHFVQAIKLINYRKGQKMKLEIDFWTPLRALFALTYLAAFIVLYCVL